MRKKIIFILSEKRSGSTWLSYVLGTHPDTAHLGEYYRPFTIAGHVACRLCEAKGQACPVFAGIENVPIQKAFDFAFDRLDVHTLVDCSKDFDWIPNFLDKDYDIRVVHLLRDPKGWFASERKRNPMSLEEGLARWNKTNQEIDDFIKQKKLKSVRVLYEDLTADPQKEFPKLCAFLGFDFDPKALHYWDKEHHGLGGNGAAFNVIGSLPDAKITTGDDQFYREKAGEVFQDDRWKTLLSSDEISFFDQANLLKKYF